MADNIVRNAHSSDKMISIGSFVWGKLGSYKWWPAIVIKSTDGGLPDARFGFVWVYWFGDHKVSQLSRKKIVSFISSFSSMYKKNAGKALQTAIFEALEALAFRFKHNHTNQTDLILWAEMGFQTSDDSFTPSNDLPSDVLQHLDHIKNLNKKPTSSDENKDTSTCAEEMCISNDKFRGLKEGSLKLEDVCIACFGNEVDIVAQHPLFEGGLCIQCKERVKETVFAFGNDGKNICCVVCAYPGSLIVCDNVSCHKSYCVDCIALLLGSDIKQQILETTPWFCFFCKNPNEEGHDLLQLKCDWEQRLSLLFQSSTPFMGESSGSNIKPKESIRVLSLFDGISTGKLALDYLGIEIEKYYASEIDEHAINVSKLHHPDSIIRLGDITQLTEEQIESMCPIDLVMGGSPCNELSLVNPIRKGLYDFSGTGPLFFEFFHILKTVERLNGNRHLFFLFENVAAMRLKDKSVITSFLMKEPVLIDAKFVSPQSRARYFWGNIPGMNLSQNYYSVPSGNSFSQHGYESDQILSHCLLKGFGRKAMVEKIRTVTTQRNSLIQDSFNLMPVEMNGEPDILWVTELEKIFGLPLHYTDTGYLSITKRRELLGRSWSVPVIVNILRPLLSFFKKDDFW